MREAIEAACARALGRRVALDAAEPVAGGSIHSCFRVAAAGGRFFVKLNDARCAAAFAAEAQGLQALREAGARTPAVLAQGVAADEAYLVLELLELSPLHRSGEVAGFAALGRMLAQVHRASNREAYGWGGDNFIGTTPQANAPAGDWTAFWRERRLMPQRARAQANAHRTLCAGLERLIEVLPVLLAGHAPPASLLHGDLWRGNAGFLRDGRPVLFDPAVYRGDREADLAMTELFGGFAPAFYDAYRECWPLDSGYALRRDLYNLYHVLNHLDMFGTGYLGQAQDLVARLLAEVRA